MNTFSFDKLINVFLFRPRLQYHLCSPMTRALLLSTYVKFVNLFPEIKGMIQNVFNQDSNIRSADAELQQRASEYLQLSNIVTTDVLVRGYFSYLGEN